MLNALPGRMWQFAAADVLRGSPDRANFVCTQARRHVTRCIVATQPLHTDCPHRLCTPATQLVREINERRADGGVWVDAPVLAQLYRVMSDGMLGFRQARTCHMRKVLA